MSLKPKSDWMHGSARLVGYPSDSPRAGRQRVRATVCRPTVRSSTTPTPSFTSATAPGRLAAGRGATRPARTTAPGWVGSPPPPPLLATEAAARGAARPWPVMPWERRANCVPALEAGQRPGGGFVPLGPGPWALPWLLAGALDRQSVSPPSAWRKSPWVAVPSYGGAYCRARAAACGTPGAPCQPDPLVHSPSTHDCCRSSWAAGPSPSPGGAGTPTGPRIRRVRC
jgi:hypothetical protein